MLVVITRVTVKVTVAVVAVAVMPVATVNQAKFLTVDTVNQQQAVVLSEVIPLVVLELVPVHIAVDTTVIQASIVINRHHQV